MTTPWRKVFRDFWRERGRTILVTLAIALGIAAFAAVLASYAILTRALNEGYLATNPASATLRTDAIDDDLVGAIRANPEIAAAEPRRVVSGRIKAGPGQWRNLVLFVVKDYGDIQVGKLAPEEGAWPPAAGEMLIERDAFQVARARIGDTVTVKTANGSEQALRVSGRVHDVGQAQARMENIVYGYITLATLAQLGEEPYLDQLKILVAQDRFNEAHIRTVAAEVKQAIEARGHAVRGVDVPPPGKHPHADIMGLLLLSISSFGLFVLLLSGILVVNLLTALMAAQVRQIGMMKAIGGSRGQIARIYFGQALLLGIAAVVIALPLGIVGSRLLCRYMAVFLNFDIQSFAIPLWVYALVAVVGLVAPLLAAARPVWKGSGISVREALADYGVNASGFGAGRLDRALAGIGGLTRPLLLALRNGFRRRTRLVLTLVTLAVGGLFFMSALNVRGSMINTLDRLFATKKFDLSVSLGAMQPVEKIERAVRNTPGVAKAESWIAVDAAVASETDGAPKPATPGADPHAGGSAGGLHGGNAAGRDRFKVLALPIPVALLAPNIVAGRDIAPGETDAIVVNTALAAKHPNIRVGSPLTLAMGPGKTTWRVVGIAREPFSPPMAYVPKAFFDQVGGHAGRANGFFLALEQHDPESINAATAALDRNLEAEGMRALASTSKAGSRFAFDQHMDMIYVFLVVMSGIIAAVGGLGLATTMSLNVLERRREMGVLRALGASPASVWLIVAAEGALIGLMSWVVAVLVAWPVSKGIGDLLLTLILKSGLDFSFDPRGPLIWLAISLGLGTAASFLPAWHASRTPVREALGYE